MEEILIGIVSREDKYRKERGMLEDEDGGRGAGMSPTSPWTGSHNWNVQTAGWGWKVQRQQRQGSLRFH